MIEQLMVVGKTPVKYVDLSQYFIVDTDLRNLMRYLFLLDSIEPSDYNK